MSVIMGFFKGSVVFLEVLVFWVLFLVRSLVSKRGIEIVFLKCELRKFED